MSPGRLEEIRLKEKLYNDNFYENVELFQEGSWLEKPVKTVMDTFELLPQKNNLRLLDLGCGVGRNSVPLAQRLKGTGGKVVCIDFLESAMINLERYGKEYGVSEVLELIRSEISNFSICPNYYDYVISVSTLEIGFHRNIPSSIRKYHLWNQGARDQLFLNQLKRSRDGSGNRSATKPYV
jgi:ubiquinone/menaquinone biosynthesis C-methylase UbiE